jgi:hypothetical protein
MVVIAFVIHGAFEVSFRGDSVVLGIGATLLIWAYLCVGALLQLLVRNLAFGLSLTGILCSPAFGFVGVGFPLLAMSGFARSWGDLLPLRWYMQIRQCALVSPERLPPNTNAPCATAARSACSSWRRSSTASSTRSPISASSSGPCRLRWWTRIRPK